MTGNLMSADNLFLKDVAAMRSRTQDYLAGGRKAANGGMNSAAAIGLLQAALAIEIVCVWRYTMMSVSVTGLRDEPVGAEFQEQANDERRHVRMVAERIGQLGGTPDFAPKGLRSHLAMDYGSDTDLDGMIAQNLAAEQSVVEYYRDLILYFRDSDPVTSTMLERILQDEEDHATDMDDLVRRDGTH
ncbi:ferritin-like domain-containing protein [Acidiphilium sp. AL]|uniref:Ferritin-like domain-containing protein n=1 Tax=Acidiphilium iwatense TaxID=768198 RepID=A0ABS9DY37_9PROT|nr:MULTISPECIES: ferritin-like domain-containing protein [Acidiphilium]MCF3947657.1 ferritin-like domain-containing protein [Acidiphilium iwatense]MCU4160908.1 ferritin-like domain-containing protein [Acidiphilium sp. AL]